MFIRVKQMSPMIRESTILLTTNLLKIRLQSRRISVIIGYWSSGTKE